MKLTNTTTHKILLYTILFVFSAIQLVNAKSNKSTQSKTFYAAAAATIITPPLGKAIIGELNSPPAEFIHDELHARCLVLDDGTTKLAFVVLDVVGFSEPFSQAAKKLIEQKTKIPTSNIIMSATHTHSASSVSGEGDKRLGWFSSDFDEYQLHVINRIAEGVEISLNNLEPAQIGWGVAKVPEHVFVRRWKMKNPVISPFGEYEQVAMNPGIRNDNKLEPSATPDPDVTFISVRSANGGRSIALLANYSLHYVGGVPEGHISANYFGEFANRIRGLLNAGHQNPSFVGIMSNGTSGDVNSVNYRGQVETFSPYAKIEKVADDLAKRVAQVNETIEFKNWVPLNAVSKNISLKIRKPDAKMLKRAKAVLDGTLVSNPRHPREIDFAKRILQQANKANKIKVPLHTFKIGDLGIASIPFEVISEIGLEIKEKSPFKTTFIIELADATYGYLPTPKQHKLGGYETWMSINNVEKNASSKIISKIIKMFSSQK